MQSGNMFNSWALNENHREASFSLAKKLGCQKIDPEEIVQYLKSVPAADLVESDITTKVFFLLFIK